MLLLAPFLFLLSRLSRLEQHSRGGDMSFACHAISGQDKAAPAFRHLGSPLPSLVSVRLGSPGIAGWNTDLEFLHPRSL